MGLFSQHPAARFLSDTSRDSVEEGTSALLSGFFDVMDVRAVHLQLGVSPLIEAHVKAATGMSLAELLQADGREPDPFSTKVFPRGEAVGQCCRRMLQTPQLPSISAGIAFGLDQEPDSPRTTWGLWLHRGPLPVLELCISDGTGFKPPGGWAESLISTEAAHVVWMSGKGYMGRPDYLYLWLKRRKLFPHSKGYSSSTAIEAGQRLRQLCQGVRSERNGWQSGPYKLSSWRWRQKRFVRDFDKMLVGRIGSDELAEILKAMGISPEGWLQACE